MAFRILDRGFKYRNANSTNVRLTFARIRRALHKQRQAEAKQLPEAKQVLKGRSR